MAGVIWDVDGVMVGVRTVDGHFQQSFLARWGFNYTSAEMAVRLGGLDAVGAHAVLDAEYTERTGRPLPEDFMRQAAAAYRRSSERHRSPVQGVPPMIRRLRASGRDMATASNSSRAALKAKLVVARLTACFEGRALSKEHVSQPKPGPEMVVEAAARMSRPVEECIMVGDTGTDIRAGRAAGVFRAVAFVPEYEDAPEVADHLARLGADEVFTAPAALEEYIRSFD